MNFFIWRASSSLGGSAANDRPAQMARQISSLNRDSQAEARATVRNLIASLSREASSLLRFVAFESEFDQTINQLVVWDSGMRPHLWVHADGREAGHGVDFV